MLDFTYEGDPRQLPASVLAYIGDAVFELYIRLNVMEETKGQMKGIHHRTISLVNAKAQASAAYKAMESLTDDEVGVFKRGRNSHSKSMAKNANPSDYQAATGFEALIGFLYLTKSEDRLKEILSLIYDDTTETGTKDR
ncbi:MAG: Mini-ribonuclease 3 [Saccharofermentanales bacterium]